MPRTYVEFDLDKPRRARLGVDEMTALEDHFDKGLVELFSKRMGISVICVVLWICFRDDEKGLTLDKTKEIIEEALETEKISLEDLMGKVGKMTEDSKLFRGKVKAGVVPQT